MRKVIQRNYAKKVWNKVTEFWQEAFPPEADIKSNFSQVKEEARKKREDFEALSAEERKQYEDEENKKRELVFVKELAVKQGNIKKMLNYMSKMKGDYKSKNKTKEVNDQDELDELEQELHDEWQQESTKLKEGLVGLKENFKEGVDNN